LGEQKFIPIHTNQDTKTNRLKELNQSFAQITTQLAASLFFIAQYPLFAGLA
jgi:hypothetical protein